MPRTRKPIKVKEPIRLRTKELANGSKSLYLDIYRNGKRTYEYLKMYLIPETDYIYMGIITNLLNYIQHFFQYHSLEIGIHGRK